MAEVSLRFLGAARHVTGTKHLLRVDGEGILLDCGMVQGPRKIANRLNRELAVRPGDVDAVVLSHAHVDHSGSLPRLVKLGFRGAIHCTEATADLAEILLQDSARIQAGDARYLSKKGQRFDPPYEIEDVERTVRAFRAHPYREPFEVLDGVTCEYFDAGHILGSAMVVLEIKRRGTHLRIGFTGDHGRKGMPILRDPERLPDLDYLITESTYGDRLHGDRRVTLDEMAAMIEEEQRDGGRILVPAFSVGRTQNLLHTLSQLRHDGRIGDLPIWVDSPLSLKATKIVARHRDLYDAQARAMVDRGENPFFFPGVRFVQSVDESIALNSVREGIILSASGMCEAGRILHHLKQSIGRREDCVCAVGYMAQGTLGRKLVEGYEHVKIFGERYRVRCKVRSLPGMSAHADYQELLDSLGHLNTSVRKVFVVHGEEDPAMRFADRLLDHGFRAVEVPVHGEEFAL